ncbi:MAG: hypothetical protein WAQ74_07980, partial [Kiritimatiellia bacterium]|jgi:hypothetical protein
VEKPALLFPRYGKFILRFSILWKNKFHGMEKFYGATGLRGGRVGAGLSFAFQAGAFLQYCRVEKHFLDGRL